MKKYYSFFRMRLIHGLQYRAAALAGISTQFAWGGMTLLMFRAFYESGAESFPMTFPQLASYIWLQQAFLSLFMAWFFDDEIFQSITGGNIAYELCRPADLYTMWFIKNISIRFSRAVLRCVPILVVGALLPAPYCLSLPKNPVAGLLFLGSLVLGCLVLTAFSMLIYISAFYTLSAMGMRLLASSAVEFLAGAIIPLPFFPHAMQQLLVLMPFAAIQNTPFQIYNGFLTGSDAVFSVLLQLFWIAALMGAGRLLMARALRKVVVQGG